MVLWFRVKGLGFLNAAGFGQGEQINGVQTCSRMFFLMGLRKLLWFCCFADGACICS